jgi:hypothetical protein
MKNNDLKGLNDYLKECLVGKEIYEDKKPLGKLRDVRVKDGGLLYLVLEDGREYPLTWPDRIGISNGLPKPD